MGILWQPYENETLPRRIKSPVHFMVTEIFEERHLWEHGYMQYDWVFARMAASFYVTGHTFTCITAQLEIAKNYYNLRGACFGMRDLGRIIWGKAVPGQRTVPAWCFDWPIRGVTLFIKEAL